MDDVESFPVQMGDTVVYVPSIDSVATTEGEGGLQIAIVNRHPDKAYEIALDTPLETYEEVRLHLLTSPSKDSYNDINNHDTVAIQEGKSQWGMEEENPS